jgi:hypothetical protein
MAAQTSAISAVVISPADDDVFHDPGMWIVVLLLAIFMLISIIGVGVIYYGDSYAVPSWNERSVPSPTLN